MWTAQSVSGAQRDSMPTDPKDTVLPLTHASIRVEVAGDVRRFRVYTAVLLPPSQRRVRMRFEGPKDSVTLELPWSPSGNSPKSSMTVPSARMSEGNAGCLVA